MSKVISRDPRHQNYRYTLTTLSPLHIGTGEELLPVEYYLDKGQNRIIIPELEKVFSSNPQQANTFLSNLASTQNKLGKTLNELFTDHRAILNPENWCYATRETDSPGPYKHAFKQLPEELKKNNGKLRLATKTTDYHVYIPGSSIKGALRTAWLYYQCLNNKEVLKQVALAQRDKFADSDLNRNFLQGEGDPKDKAYDLFRVLQVGDSQTQAAKEVLGIVGEQILNATDSAWIALEKKRAETVDSFKNSWTFYEAIRRDALFCGKLNFDIGLLTDPKAIRKMGWYEDQQSFSLAKLCQATNEFAKDICQWEIKYFNRIKDRQSLCNVDEVIKFYQKLLPEINSASSTNTIYLSLGHSSGWHKLTIGLLLEKHLSTKEFQDLREKFFLAQRHLDFEYPKTRKLPMSDQNKAARPFGWVKIVFDKE